MSTASCLYEGTVRHRRADPPREFRHRLALAYLDLEELPALLGGTLLRRRPGLVRFRRPDYLGDPRVPLEDAVRDAVQAQTGGRPSGPVRVLTHPRSLGHCFNPVSFYFCVQPGNGRLEALVAEVTNTPWGERHAYVVGQGCGDGHASGIVEGSFAKALHVSPFLGMDHSYICRATIPARMLSIQIESMRCGERVFDATLALTRRELTRRSLADVTLRYPAPTVRVLALIYAHALALRLAGTPVFPHPGGARS